jgi:hypothetical protein
MSNSSVLLFLSLVSTLAVTAMPPQTIVVPPEFAHLFDPARAPCPGSAQVTRAEVVLVFGRFINKNQRSPDPTPHHVQT